MPFLAQSDRDSVTLANVPIAPSEWQSQMLELIDPDEFSEQSYARLMEMLDDLDLERNLRSGLWADSAGRRRHAPQPWQWVA